MATKAAKSLTINATTFQLANKLAIDPQTGKLQLIAKDVVLDEIDLPVGVKPIVATVTGFSFTDYLNDPDYTPNCSVSYMDFITGDTVPYSWFAAAVEEGVGIVDFGSEVILVPDARHYTFGDSVVFDMFEALKYHTATRYEINNLYQVNYSNYKELICSTVVIDGNNIRFYGCDYLSVDDHTGGLAVGDVVTYHRRQYRTDIDRPCFLRIKNTTNPDPYYVYAELIPSYSPNTADEFIAQCYYYMPGAVPTRTLQNVVIKNTGSQWEIVAIL